MNKLSAPHWAFSSESGLAARPEPLIPNRHLLELTALRTPNTMCGHALIQFRLLESTHRTVFPRADKDVEQKDSEWVRLQSTDGFSYLVRRKVASASGTIKNMLDAEGGLCFSLRQIRRITDCGKCHSLLSIGGGYSEALTRVCDVRERCARIRHFIHFRVSFIFLLRA